MTTTKYFLVLLLGMVLLSTASLADHHESPKHEHKPPKGEKPPPKHKPLPEHKPPKGKGEKPPPEHKPPHKPPTAN